MKYFGFSIASLMVVVGFVAVILAAFRESSALWASITFSLTLACLSAASVLAICGRARPAWAGMAVFGFVYIHFAFEQIEYPPVLTSNLLDATAEKVLEGKKGEVATRRTHDAFTGLPPMIPSSPRQSLCLPLPVFWLPYR